MPEAGPWIGLAWRGFAWTVALALLTWIVSSLKRDVSLVDRVWPLLIGGAAAVYLALWPQTSMRAGWAVALVIAWALRLCVYITGRNWGHGEDRRYRDIRARNQPHFALKSLYLVFGLQALLAWIVSMPLLAAVVGTHAFGAAGFVGIGLAGFGIVFEAIADAQLARFKADASNRARVMDRGLWRWSRHPNYFGEACVWWGLWLMASSGGGALGACSIVAPLLMTVLLLRVSGVRLLEQDITDRRPAYRDYIGRTNAFIPWPPRARIQRP